MAILFVHHIKANSFGIDVYWFDKRDRLINFAIMRGINVVAWAITELFCQIGIQILFSDLMDDPNAVDTWIPMFNFEVRRKGLPFMKINQVVMGAHRRDATPQCQFVFLQSLLDQFRDLFSRVRKARLGAQSGLCTGILPN